MLGQAYATSDDLKTAERWVDEGLATIARTSEDLFLPELYLIKGKLVGATAGKQADCDRWLMASMEAAVKQSAKLSELRTMTVIAKLKALEGRVLETRALLSPVYGWFTEGFDTPVLQDARALLDELA